MPSNTTRIAKNTLALYFRQILIMLVSLYTVRVVLEVLGTEDYGIYNVVAGVVTMFGFLSGSMATASQRYFSFELGRGNFEQLKKVFSLSLLIYVFIAVLVLLLAETIGLWFVANKLVIPLERRSPALWVYQFSIISFLFTILASPYMAMIIANEDMNIYAYVSIVDAALKLGLVFFLRFILFDKLQLYAILMLIITVVVTSTYIAICSAKYRECKFSSHNWDKKLFKEIVSYSGWSMFGASVGVFKFQMVNIVLNQFFNPVVVAARSIAAQINGATASFSQNFSTAIRPQIIKLYAAEQKEAMLSLVFRGSKGTYLLMYIFVLPLVLEMPIVLGLWLKNPPEYTVLFARLVLLDVLIDAINFPLMTAIHATGKIKLHQVVAGGILLLNLPVSWVALLMGYPPYSVMVIAIIITFITFIVRLAILRQLICYSILKYFATVIVPLFGISVTSAVLPVILHYTLAQDMMRLCFVVIIGVGLVIICSYYMGMNRKERLEVKSKVHSYINSERNKKQEKDCERKQF